MRELSIRSQAIINTAGNTVYLLALWLLTVFTTRILGYEDAGTFTLAMAVGNALAMVQLFGVRSYQSSDMSFRYSAKDYLSFRIITVVVGWIVGVVVCVIIGYSLQISLSIILFTFLKSSETFSDVLFENEQRLDHLELSGYSMAARGIVIIFIYYVAANCSGNINIALLCTAVSVLLLSICIDLPVHNKVIRSSTVVHENGVMGIIRDCFPLLIATLIPTVITAVPRIVLERYYGKEILGYYGNVSTPALLMTTVVPTILMALLPLYGKAVEKNETDMIRKYWIVSLIGVMIIALLCELGVCLVGRPVLMLTYIEKIVPYIDYLYYVIIATLLYSMVMCNNAVLVAFRKNWGITWITLASLIICVIISVPLVRIFGISGAITVLAGSYGVQVIIQTVWILYLYRRSCV